ncbi:MAG TPA: sensor histidine kinase [Actinophytocola sp.]|uniref:sensor histidine kinase n=1 Tax=Actinophytocola sp. TaxID=1872138 RepID=UPI002DDD4783|nr:sensor histidine kinase [Actinophytocola sp.]HEV2784105.1 sensor histidine kinase [Actinophytocola sp.]
MHPALFYRGIDDYLAGVGGFVRNGLAAGEPVFVSVPPERLAPLRAFLGVDADRVVLHDMSEVGRNPGRILTALTDFAARRGAGRAWLVGEPIWPSRSPLEIREATRHEALINLAFADVPVTILCPYDVSGLDPHTVADAWRTHPVVWADGAEMPSTEYADPYAVSTDCDALPAEEPAKAVRMSLGPGELALVRMRAVEFGRASGLPPERLADLKLAVGEAAANTLRHGGGAGKVTMWRTPTEVIVEVRDGGRLADPLSGRLRPPLGAVGGRGLWLIHQVCDLVELGSGLLRLHMRITARAEPAP